MGFARGEGPLVSIMVPTRGRIQGLIDSVMTFWSMARDKSLLEFLFKVDDDDPASIGTINNLVNLGLPCQTLISPRGGGYHDMHLWINQLAGVAKGDWLIIANDDIKMITEAWDQSLLKYQVPYEHWHGVEDVVCLVIQTMESSGWGFFFLRRKVVEILGRFSYIPHNDTWVTTLMRSVDSLFVFPEVGVVHIHNQEDQTHRDGNDARLTTNYTTHHPDQAKVKLQDALKLQEYIDAHRKDINVHP